MTMKIADIRRVIESANWNRNDLSGSTRDEWLAQDIAGRLQPHIDRCRALVIPARFVTDEADRKWAIEAAQAVIARWHAAHGRPVDGNVLVAA